MTNLDSQPQFKVRCVDGVVAIYRPHPLLNPWHCYNTTTGEFIEARTDKQVSRYHPLPTSALTPPTPWLAPDMTLAELEAIEDLAQYVLRAPEFYASQSETRLFARAVLALIARAAVHGEGAT